MRIREADEPPKNRISRSQTGEDSGRGKWPFYIASVHSEHQVSRWASSLSPTHVLGMAEVGEPTGFKIQCATRTPWNIWRPPSLFYAAPGLLA